MSNPHQPQLQDLPWNRTQPRNSHRMNLARNTPITPLRQPPPWLSQVGGVPPEWLQGIPPWALQRAAANIRLPLLPSRGEAPSRGRSQAGETSPQSPSDSVNSMNMWEVLQASHVRGVSPADLNVDPRQLFPGCILPSPQEASGSGQQKPFTGNRKKVKRKKSAHMQGGRSKLAQESPFASPYPSSPEELEPFFLDAPPPPDFLPSQARPSECIGKAAELRKEGNELFRKDNFVGASEKYKSALFWISPLVQRIVPKDVDAQIAEAYRETVIILSNLSSAMLKLDKPVESITAATECISLNRDRSYYKGYFRRAEGLKAVGNQISGKGGDPVQYFLQAIKDYGECYNRMGDVSRETEMRIMQYHNALELAVSCSFTRFLPLVHDWDKPIICNHLLKIITNNTENGYEALLCLHFLLVKIPQLPNSGMANELPCNASFLSFAQIIKNISMTTPVMAALIDKGLVVSPRDLNIAADIMDQGAVTALHFLIEHVLNHATYLFTFLELLHRVIRLDKEAFVALMLTRQPVIVFVTPKTVSVFCQSVTMLNPGMVVSIIRYSPLRLRIKMLLLILSLKKMEIVPFIFEVAPCHHPKLRYVTPSHIALNSTIDKVFQVSRIMRYCTAIIGAPALAVKMAVCSQHMTPLFKCAYINYMLKIRGVDIRHVQGRGGSSPLHCATMLTLKSGYVALLRTVCNLLVHPPSNLIEDEELQTLVKVAKSARPKAVSSRVQKELLRFLELKRNPMKFFVGSGGVAGSAGKGKISNSLKTKKNGSSVGKSVRNTSNDSSTNPCEDGQTSEVKSSFKDAKSKVQDLRSKANQMLKRNSYEAALKFYEAALIVCGDDLPADQTILNEKVSLYCKMAETCLKIQPGRAEKALVYAGNAVKLDPAHSKSYMYAAKALKLLSRMEESLDKYCECYLHLLAKEDAGKLQAQVLHSAITIALEHGLLKKLLIVSEVDGNKVASALVKLAMDSELSSQHRFGCLLFLFVIYKAKSDSDFLVEAKLKMASFSLSVILPCAAQKDFEVVFDALLTNIVKVTVADIEEGIRSLSDENQVHFLERMVKNCSCKLDTSHFTHFAELALEQAKKVFLVLMLENGAQPDADKLMQAFASNELHGISTRIQRYMLHALSEKKSSKLVLDLIVHGSISLDLSLALKLVMEHEDFYFSKQSVIRTTTSSSAQQRAGLDDIDATSNELAASGSGALVGDGQASARFESKPWDMDGLAWEVECTRNVKLFLNKSAYALELRKAVVSKIHAMASGERSKSLSKQLANKLYETKLTKSVRIVWEEPIQFSPRLTLDPANPIYSEVIRVWDVTMNHEQLHNTVQNVLASRERGTRANLKLYLVENTVEKHNVGLKLPRQFRAVQVHADSNVKELCVPVTSPNRDEYVLLPFYQVSTAYLESILNSDNDRRDLPFKVSPEEHQIITLPTAKEAILLLGRSGTGKTTCCVYRMWNQFRQHWVQAPSYAVADEMSHLHQVFVTKNDALCERIKCLFYNMAASHRCLSKHLPYESCKLPRSLQQVKNLAYPLFLTSKEFFIILDASLGTPFFPRRPDNSLAVCLITDGQLYERKNVAAIQQLFNFSDEEPLQTDPFMPRAQWGIVTEVTASYFSTRLWPHICPDKKLDPILVWMEIKSFIKGSHEALQCERGFLSLEQYEEVGKKKAPNFEGNRREIYSLFEKYQKILSRSKDLFDECDFVRSLYMRLMAMSEQPKWHLDHLFVDEVQDFTEAELAVFIQCCREPNSLFFTGDTAQSIMRGVAFRFSDLTSLFYYAQKKRLPFQRDVAVPSQIHRLKINFRSHANILDLACSVIDIMSRFFPKSFDTLPSDTGMFPGPIPVLIRSCRQEDLMQLLTRNKRGSSPSLLGAHQVIIVRNEKAKKNLPEGLKDEIVLTVFESKGLEFDDVLLYNFFSDSMSKEGRNSWQVVTAYANEEGWKNEGSVALPSAGQIRPLKFDENQDKSLLSELKHLYTAITRAKCNFWVYDTDETRRLPVFDYWNRRKLVKIVDVTDHAQEDEIILQTNTTSEQWERQGDYYKEHSLFDQAASCYRKAEAMVKLFQAEAFSKVVRASYSELSQTKISFLEEAAHQFLLCDLIEHDTDHLVNACKCLQRTGHKEVAALLRSRLTKGGCFESGVR